MAEQLPPGENSSEPPSLDSSDNPPEPTLPIPRNNSLSASLRAHRGSPAPEAIGVDSLPDSPAGNSVLLQDPEPPGNGHPVADPFQSASVISSNSSAPSLPRSTTGPEQSVRPGHNHPIDPQEVQINRGFFDQLLELGFDEWTAKLSLQRTGNTGTEEAVQWIVERSNESDFESGESSDSDDEEDVEMGAVQSGEGGAGTDAAANLVRNIGKNMRTHKMVFVANMSLKMGTGKLAAQVGHACLGVYQKAMSTEEGRVGVQSWQRMGAVKIVLKGESTEQLMELFKLAKDAGCVSYLVQDAGYTQIPPGSRTVLGVFGPVSAVDSVTGGLKLL